MGNPLKNRYVARRFAEWVMARDETITETIALALVADYWNLRDDEQEAVRQFQQEFDDGWRYTNIYVTSRYNLYE